MKPFLKTIAGNIRYCCSHCWNRLEYSKYFV